MYKHLLRYSFFCGSLFFSLACQRQVAEESIAKVAEESMVQTAGESTAQVEKELIAQVEEGLIAQVEEGLIAQVEEELIAQVEEEPIAQVAEESMAGTAKQKSVMTRIQIISRKVDAEKQPKVLKQVAGTESNRKMKTDSAEKQPTNSREYHLMRTPDRKIRFDAYGLLERLSGSLQEHKTPPRTPTREKAKEVLDRCENSKS